MDNFKNAQLMYDHAEEDFYEAERQERFEEIARQEILDIFAIGGTHVEEFFYDYGLTDESYAEEYNSDPEKVAESFMKEYADKLIKDLLL